MNYSIRAVINSDQRDLLALMAAHALYEGMSIDLRQSEHLVENLVNSPATILVVESNHQLVGYMSMIKQFSTWDLAWYLYLDCLYLEQAARGHGIGKELMNKLRAYAKENQLKTIQWQTPVENLAAINFYQQLGTEDKSKQRFFWPV